MNNFKRKKLGLSRNDYLKDIQKSEEKISKSTPISLDKTIKDFNAYSQIDIKTINVGTLKKPVEKLVAFDVSTQGYHSLELTNPLINKPYYFKKSFAGISLKGEVFNYQSNLRIDQNNPYDPLFASFDRLYSLSPRITNVSGVTGIIYGEKEKFSFLSESFGKSSNFLVKNAGSNLNGTFIPSGTFNGKIRYVNSSLTPPAEIIYVSSTLGSRPVLTAGTGWMIRQLRAPLTFVPGSTSRGWRIMYLNLDTGITVPTGNSWATSGNNWRISSEGQSPLPNITNLETEGFFKLATSRVNRQKITATNIGTGLTVGNTAGNVPPQGASFVPYPHSYNVRNYPALRYNSILAFGSDTKINDIVVISTGISSKKIVYISPHNIEMFAGFWAELSNSNRTPITGITGRIIDKRNTYQLQSGTLLSVSSEGYSIPTFSSYINNDIYDIGNSYIDLRPESIISGLHEEINLIYSYSGSGLLNDYYSFPSGSVSGVEQAVQDIASLNESVELFNDPLILQFLSDLEASGLSSSIEFPEFTPGGTYFFDTGLRLKQDSPIINTAFYKLYETLYRRNTFNTGTWNGIIPSGVPFCIETVRTKNAEITTPEINVYILNAFVNTVSSGSGSFQSVMPGYTEERKRCLTYVDPSDPKSCSYSGIKQFPYFGYGTFYGSSIQYSPNNIYEATYLSEKRAMKQANSKLKGYLWQKGLLKGNSKSRKMMLLMDRLDLVKENVKGGIGIYCKDYVNPSDPMSCSYTGTSFQSVMPGIETRAGFRLSNNNLIENTYIFGEKVSWKKALPYDYATIPAPTTTTTTTPAPTTECLTSATIVNIVSSGGNKYVFNNSNTYDPNKKYGMGIGTYVFENVPQSHPIAILNSAVEYIGDEDKKISNALVGNNTYNFYWGNVTVAIYEDFGLASLYCLYHGYMGGENLLIYSDACTIDPTATTTTTPAPTTTTTTTPAPTTTTTTTPAPGGGGGYYGY